MSVQKVAGPEPGAEADLSKDEGKEGEEEEEGEEDCEPDAPPLRRGIYSTEGKNLNVSNDGSHEVEASSRWEANMDLALAEFESAAYLAEVCVSLVYIFRFFGISLPSSISYPCLKKDKKQLKEGGCFKLSCHVVEWYLTLVAREREGW